MAGTDHMHVVSHDSAAGTLKSAIRSGTVPKGLVFSVIDPLAYGPIGDLLDADARRTFLNAITHESLRQEGLWDSDAMFPDWTKIFEWEGSVTVWWSSLSAFEYTLYLVLLKHAANVTDFEFVDAGLIAIPPFKGFSGTGEMNAEQWAHAYKKRRRLTPEEIEKGRALFSALNEQNAPLRYVDDGTLLGGKLDTHDWILRKFITPVWRKAAYCIGYAMTEGDYHQAGDWFLFNRLRAIIDTGEVEARGDAKNMRSLEVRWPNGSKAPP